MTLFFDLTLPTLPDTPFGINSNSNSTKMNHLDQPFDIFQNGSTADPSASTAMGSLASLAADDSPSYAAGTFGTPYSSTSDTSLASSPDIQSLLPLRHQWPTPISTNTTSAPWYLPTPTSTFEGTPTTSSPVGAWVQSLDGDDSTHDDRRARHSHSHSHSHSHAPSPALIHPHARHHPYAESSMAGHHRALSMAALTGGMTIAPTLSPHTIHGHSHGHGHGHAHNHAAARSSAAAAPTNANGDDRPKSGRLGVKRRQKYTRTRTGCLGCRARRIKCDEGRPVCRRCTVAKRECVFPDPNEAKKPKKAGWAQSDSEEESTHPSANGNGNGSTKSSGSQQRSAPAIDATIAPAAQPALLTHDGMPRGALTPLTPPTPFDLTQMPEGFGATSNGAGTAHYDTTNGEQLPLGDSFSDMHMRGHSALGFDISASGLDMGGVHAHSHAYAAAASAAAAALGAAAVEEVKDKWAAGHGHTPILNAPNFLLPWFPTAQEQVVILHYCANAADLMMAIPRGLNPLLAINLPLALSWPRGTNAAADALRVALLGIGAVHQAFLLARAGAHSSARHEAFEFAARLRTAAKRMVAAAVTVVTSNPTPTGTDADAALSAAASLATIDILFGGSGWHDNFAIALRLVQSRGGPAAVLAHARPARLAHGVTATPARLVLEMLAIYEGFGCLTTEQEPTLLGESDQSDTWWFASKSAKSATTTASGSSNSSSSSGMSNGNNSTNTYAYDDKSVETLFGLSKGMVHLFSRVVRLLSRVGRLGRFLNEKEVDAYGTTVPAEKEKEKEQTADNSIAFSVEALNADAAAVQRDMDSWIASLRSPTLEQADEHERVHSGNAAYAHALRLLLLRQIYGRPRSDPDVQSSAQHALQHCSSSAAAGMGIDLMWPAILGACELGTISKEHSEGHEHRLWVKALLEGFRAQCCFDVDVAQRIVAEVWRRDDKGEKGADWKSVCKDLGLKVLLC